jgi:hypothetical protein
MTASNYELWEFPGVSFTDPEIVDVQWSVEAGLRIGVAEGLNAPVSAWIEFDLNRAFQGIDDGYRLQSGPTERGLLWRVHDSEYLREFRRAAAGTMDNFPLTHWLLISGNQCVDVISDGEPSLCVAGSDQSLYAQPAKRTAE